MISRTLYLNVLVEVSCCSRNRVRSCSRAMRSATSVKMSRSACAFAGKRHRSRPHEALSASLLFDFLKPSSFQVRAGCHLRARRFRPGSPHLLRRCSRDRVRPAENRAGRNYLAASRTNKTLNRLTTGNSRQVTAATWASRKDC